MSMKYKGFSFGHIKDKRDPRDRLYQFVPGLKIPEMVILTDLIPKIRDQGNEGSLKLGP